MGAAAVCPVLCVHILLIPNATFVYYFLFLFYSILYIFAYFIRQISWVILCGRKFKALTSVVVMFCPNSHTSAGADVVILGGDLNMHPQDLGCRLLRTSTGLRDSYMETSKFDVGS